MVTVVVVVVVVIVVVVESVVFVVVVVIQRFVVHDLNHGRCFDNDMLNHGDLVPLRYQADSESTMESSTW